MQAPINLEITLARPANPVNVEPEEPAYALLRVRPDPEAAQRPHLQVCFLLDASASMHRFVLDPEQRAQWQQRAESRGEVTRQKADGRTGMVWTGQTLRELQRHVSTPMISTLRGVWRTLEALQPSDAIGVLAFADQFGVIYEDAGAGEPAQRLEAARIALRRLSSGVDESGLGRGTRLAGALQHALEQLSQPGVAALRRIVLVSDGIIEDGETCRALVSAAVDRGLVVSVIGVGDDFDEEFLMTIADMTRGNYYYAATAPEVEQAMARELEIISRVVGRQAMLRVKPENRTLLHDVYPVAPALAEFQTLWVDRGAWHFRIGDLSAAQPMEFLLELAPAAHPDGEVRLASVSVEALAAAADEPIAAQGSVRLFYTADPALLRAQADDVLDAIKRLEIHREERRASIAAARGDAEASTRHLREATRMLRNLGADSLADDMDAAAAEAETGTRNLSRDKRVKAGTRRLGQPARAEEPAEPAGTRNLRPDPKPQPAPGSETRQLR